MEKNTETKVPQDGEKKEENPYVIAGSIIIAGFLIAATVIYANSPRSGEKKPATAGVIELPKISSPTNEELAGEGAILGNPRAPVTVVEFSDFQCPFCEKFYQTTVKQITEKYVKTGKVKFVYRHYPFLGTESLWAAEASECAREQNKFWEYYDYLFEHQGAENSGAFSKENLKYFAVVIKLDNEKFNQCLDSDKYAAVVSKDKIDGDRFGVKGTPTTFVNGEILVGAVPFSQKEADSVNAPKGFETVIEEKLKK